MTKVLIKKLDTTVELPSYKTSGASGMDLMAFIKEPITLKPQKSLLFRCERVNYLFRGPTPFEMHTKASNV